MIRCSDKVSINRAIPTVYNDCPLMPDFPGMVKIDGQKIYPVTKQNSKEDCPEFVLVH
jgi:hypothetical protein